ncbi:hypothetical protein ACJMK2_010450 [Sinanodonta woodiana]|uniref:DUF7920 domain-containing protein n=1 Tax=Sinanodonta woodiana TaxID=1069815 RepID=A0ABD3VGS8_SINWO
MSASIDIMLDAEKFSETVRFILDRIEGGTYQDIEKHLSSIKSTKLKTDQEEKAERWLQWAKMEKNLKVIGAKIPSGVLPHGYQGELIDVKVFVKYGPDDAVYDNNETIRDRVARGNCFLSITTGPRAGTTCVLQAMKKFTGGMGDDDDRESGDESVWERYFTKGYSDADRVIVTEKVNGEAAHLSCIEIEGEKILCGGSKNVHLLFRNKADIEKYVEPRYRIAQEVCEAVMTYLDDMKPQDKTQLLQFLVHSGYTAVFEILVPDHQHVVNLSQLKRSELQFITWTECELQPAEKKEHLNVIPPHVGIEIAKALGLQTVKYEVVEMQDIQKRMRTIRQQYDLEGEVLYFLDKQGLVIGILKKKTTWYIMCRAIREKLKAAGKLQSCKPEVFSLSNVQNKMVIRINDIQKWLDLDHETTASWKDLAIKAMKWILHKLNQGDITQEEVQDKFPIVWKKFLECNGETDRIEVKFMR